jgi:ATP-dependent protease ClpP protease subunit
LIVPNEKYRPNPDRAVYVQGLIDQALVYRLTPRIVSLQAQERSPITVYIDSPGGNVAHMESLWRLLTAANQDSSLPCRVITVVTSRAASAAADLLSSGDYAIALPQSTILYHGVRTFRETPLTVETTSILTEILRLTNETYAMELVRKIESRFMFRFLLAKNRFDEIRSELKKRKLTDTECFLAVISEGLSDRARKLFETARERHGRYEALLKIAKSGKNTKHKRPAKLEAARIKAIVDFEAGNNKGDKNWSFQGGGLARVTDDFFLLNEHLTNAQGDRLNRLCAQWGRFSLAKEDQEEIDRLPEEQKTGRLIQKVRPKLEPLWAFFVALCHALQEGENELTATDAYWLGLIDEVIGESDLPSLRVFVEFTPDPPESAQS